MLWSFAYGISSEENSQAVATVKNELNDGIKIPRLEGSAIFKLDKLVGYIDGEETLYMLMIKNKLKEGLITIKNVLNSDTSITLEIYGNKTKLTPLYNNGRASIIIDISLVTGIEEVQGTKDLMKEENLKIFQNEAEKEIAVRVQYLISKLQKEYNSDVLGFGKIFANKEPKASKNFKKNGEDIFLAIKSTVNVNLKIKRSGETIKPISIEK
jgi:spore germination protein KC